MFLRRAILISKHSSLIHALLHSQIHVVGLHIQSLLQEPQSSNFYTNTDIHYDPIFSLNYTPFHSIHIFTHTIYLQLQTLFHLLLTLN